MDRTATGTGTGIWAGRQLDLDTYLSRVGFEGDRAPTPATLRALHRGHTLSLPFENLDVILGRTVRLDIGTLQDKLLRRPRGGYCYEHTSLFAAVLERLGFGVTALSGRIRMGSDKVLPATHAVLRVETADTPRTGRVWLCDVGFGVGPLVPVELADGAEAADGDWHYRLGYRTVTPGAEGWVLYVWDAETGSWFDRHGFTLDPQYPVDYELGSHFIATHPHSPFTTRAFVQRVFPDRVHALDGTTLTAIRPADGSHESRELHPREVPEALDDLFGIRLPAADTQALVARSEADAARASATA